jgi:hypothetical protein
MRKRPFRLHSTSGSVELQGFWFEKDIPVKKLMTAS